ncbi:MAG: serine protease [Planctomycetaceae bacterium]|jgi:hypothetical protein|nr:serine protease [Planctomycetaceae bacterium]
MARIGRLVLLFKFTLAAIICTLGVVHAGDFGVPRRSVNGSVAQSRELTSQNRNYAAPANNTKSEQPFPNIARLVAFDQNGQSFGSCSYIGSAGDYGIIVSNWHVICEADGLVHVHFPSGFSSFGAIVQFDRKWDLAVIVISKPPTIIQPLPIMQTAPRPGEPLWVAGYGAGSYRIASGYCVEYLAPEIPRNGTAPSFEIIKLSTTARQGDSGGPILNKNGELAGVLFGSDMVTSTAGSHCERVKWFLEQVNPILTRLPRKPEALFASIEPTGPKHALNGSQLDTKGQNQIVQVKNIPATSAVSVPVEKTLLIPLNNNDNNRPPNNNQNNQTNEKEKISTRNSYNKSAQLNQIQNKNTNTPEKYSEKRPAIAKENEPVEQLKTAEWAFNNEQTENIDDVKKNYVVPSANFQAVDEKPEPKVTMAILHFTNDQIKIPNETSVEKDVDRNTVADNKNTPVNVGDTSGKELGQVERSRRYVVAATVVVFSLLFYLPLRFLNKTDNNKKTDNQTTPDVIPLKPNTTQNIQQDDSTIHSKKHKHNQKAAA